MDHPAQDIVVERPDAGVVQITLHRPEFRNALRTQTLAEIADVLAVAAADSQIKAVVLTGGLECFAAGADVREMAPLGPVDILTHERQRHWRAIGKALTMQMVLTGQPINAQMALAAGLVVEVDEPESALARSVEIASVIATKPALAIRLAKEAVLRAYETPLAEGLVAERQAFALLAASHDRNEGIAALLEKRTPDFTGR